METALETGIGADSGDAEKAHLAGAETLALASLPSLPCRTEASLALGIEGICEKRISRSIYTQERAFLIALLTSLPLAGGHGRRGADGNCEQYKDNKV